MTSPSPPPDVAIKRLLEPVPLPVRDPDYALPGKLHDRPRNGLVKAGAKTTVPSGIITADNVRVALPLGIHSWDGQLFEDALLGVECLHNTKYILTYKSIPFRKKRRAGEAVLLTMFWYSNYYHWMIEIIPRLAFYEATPELKDLKLIVPRQSPRFVKRSLELLGYEDRVEYLDNGVWEFERLHIPTRISCAGDVSPFAIDWLHKAFPKRPVDTQTGRRIYVSRADALKRFISNEDELQETLADFGFETVVMSNHPLEAQIEMFRNADIVVGSHGAGFANAAFMAPGATLIELFEERFLYPCFHRIACLNDLKYGFLVGRKTGLGFSIDPEDLRRILEIAMGKPATQAVA